MNKTTPDQYHQYQYGKILMLSYALKRTRTHQFYKYTTKITTITPGSCETYKNAQTIEIESKQGPNCTSKKDQMAERGWSYNQYRYDVPVPQLQPVPKCNRKC
jgi:hypothetical protein